MSNKVGWASCGRKGLGRVNLREEMVYLRRGLSKLRNYGLLFAQAAKS